MHQQIAHRHPCAGSARVEPIVGDRGYHLAEHGHGPATHLLATKYAGGGDN
jgi:hypothetical protein